MEPIANGTAHVAANGAAPEAVPEAASTTASEAAAGLVCGQSTQRQGQGHAAEHAGIRLLALDLDGTLLHGADTFEGRFLSQRAIDAVRRAHDAGLKIVVSTARPVSTGLAIVQRMPVDACVYLNGALIDFDPLNSTYESLTRGDISGDGSLVGIGFDARRACEVCRMLTERMPGLKCGIVMNDVRYTNFDVSVFWKTQTWRYTDFRFAGTDGTAGGATEERSDEACPCQDTPEGAGRHAFGAPAPVPAGTCDKLILFPERDRWEELRALIPDDFAVSISEGVMWMLMNPLANKAHSLGLVCDRLGIPMAQAAAFGDDLIDIPMMRTAGLGVAVANANPEVFKVADEICPSNDDDGVAQWIDDLISGSHDELRKIL